MPYKLIELIQMAICRFFGHRKGKTWIFEGSTYFVCKRCNCIFAEEGYWEEMPFKDAVSKCEVGSRIYRRHKAHKKYTKTPQATLEECIPFLDRLSKDWMVED